MSVRDEMAAKVFQCIVMDRHPDEIADALMPIVERVAREGARAGYVCSGRKPHDEWLDAIVARVVGR